MDWPKYLPSIIALIGIPLAAFLAWWRERDLKNLQHRRETAIRQEAQAREDSIRREQREREDTFRYTERRIDAYADLLSAGTVLPVRSGFYAFIKDRAPTSEREQSLRETSDILTQALFDGAAAYHRVSITGSSPTRAVAQAYWNLVGGTFFAKAEPTKEELDAIDAAQDALLTAIRAELQMSDDERSPQPLAPG